MTLTSETKLFIGIFGFTALIIAFAMFIMTRPAKPIAKESLILPTTNTKGSKDAPVWLVEFSDFECPACKAFSSVVSELITTYPDKLLIAYRYFPLDSHPQSIPAAIAAESAGKQGKFWEMEQLLFTNQEDLHSALYENFAVQLNLDMTLFKASMSDPSIKQTVLNDISYGNSIGINATPTFYLNGLKLNLTTVDDLKIQVEQLIQKLK